MSRSFVLARAAGPAAQRDARARDCRQGESDIRQG
jgi:hypothetical protein